MSRRSVLLGLAGAFGLALPTSSLLAATANAATTVTPVIRRRVEWAGSLPVRGPLTVEEPGNTRFLEVHHSVQPNNSYARSEVPAILRSFYEFHVSKGWPDIAYNFLIDRFGTIWEGRKGSFDAPVIPSATGGHQGFSQKVCFIGDHRTAAPTAVANDSMVSTLARLANKYGIPTVPGSTATFVSRGSGKLPRGTRCTLPTIVGHRAVAVTACPGDAAHHQVVHVYPGLVTRARAPRPRFLQMSPVPSRP